MLIFLDSRWIVCYIVSMKLSIKGIEILIDKWNLDLIRDYNWSFNCGYLHARINGEIQLLHVIIAKRMGLNCSDQIDHIDRNKLNNQQENLRSATHSQNMMNRPKQKNNTSGFKGVSRDNRRQKWRANIQVKNKYMHLGYFDDPIDAAYAYDKAALKHFGGFAYLNFPHLKLTYLLSFLFRA